MIDILVCQTRRDLVPFQSVSQLTTRIQTERVQFSRNDCHGMTSTTGDSTGMTTHEFLDNLRSGTTIQSGRKCRVQECSTNFLPSPNCPNWSDPKAKTLPSLVRRTECEYPAAMSTTFILSTASTLTGVVDGRVSLFPSCPYSFCPQANTRPLADKAMQCIPPASTGKS